MAKTPQWEVWEVTGGEATGGILVRRECEVNSEQLGRLATGAQVKILDRRGDRILYEVLSGSGPRTGWVSLKLKEKALLVPKAAAAGAPTAAGASPAAPRSFKEVDTKLTGKIDAAALDEQPDIVAQGGPQGTAPDPAQTEFEAHIFAIVNDAEDLRTLNPRMVKNELEKRLGLPEDSLKNAFKVIREHASIATKQRLAMEMAKKELEDMSVSFTALLPLGTKERQGRDTPSPGSAEALASEHVAAGRLDAAVEVLSKELARLSGSDLESRHSDASSQTTNAKCAALLVARGHVWWRDLRFMQAHDDFSQAERLQPGGVASASLLFLRHCLRLDSFDTSEPEVVVAGRNLTKFFKEAASNRRACSQKRAELQAHFRPRAAEPLNETETKWACPGMQILDGTCQVEAYSSHPAVDIGYRMLVNRESAPEKTALFVYYHGNGEIAPEYTSWADVYKKFPCTFMVFDYRGYGWSTGEPHTECLTADPIVCTRKLPDLLQRHQLPWPWPGAVILMGRSLGSAVAGSLIAHFPDMFDGLIIESGMASTMEERHEEILAWSGSRREETSATFQTARELLQTSLPPGCALGQELIAPLGTCEAIRGYRGPVLVLHGSMDFIVNPRNARLNYEAATNSCDRELAEFPADHNSLAGLTPFWVKQLQFTRKILKSKQESRASGRNCDTIEEAEEEES